MSEMGRWGGIWRLRREDGRRGWAGREEIEDAALRSLGRWVSGHGGRIGRGMCMLQNGVFDGEEERGKGDEEGEGGEQDEEEEEEEEEEEAEEAEEGKREGGKEERGDATEATEATEATDCCCAQNAHRFSWLCNLAQPRKTQTKNKQQGVLRQIPAAELYMAARV